MAVHPHAENTRKFVNILGYVESPLVGSAGSALISKCDQNRIGHV